ncbi:MAG TPA: transporter, partial [Pyrinomonadaceae bacterium]|nr:transporter [Pyrinomonadaceae bacterium]
MTLMEAVFGAFFLVLLAAAAALAQQPFVTDDADVTNTGHFHVELGNEFDRLQPTSLPISYQDGARATLSYGLVKNLEVGVSGQFLVLESRAEPHAIGGVGDTSFTVKYKVMSEREDSRRPALAISGYIQLPTGSAARALGSGKTDLGVNGIVQKKVGEKNVVHLNAGYLFAGNTLTGVLGLSSVRGHVFTGGASFVRTINEKLQLGGEVATAVT